MSLPTAMKTPKLNFEVPMLLQCHYRTLLLVGGGEGGGGEKKWGQKKTKGVAEKKKIFSKMG